jgi:homocysteine S-methyltransferase
MAKYAKRLIQAGAKFVGGCCGTTPEHIKQIANAVAALSPGRSTVRVFVAEDKPPDVKVVPKAERSRLAKRYAKASSSPRSRRSTKGCDPSKMLEGVRC